jgi:hypothetical protein
LLRQLPAGCPPCRLTQSTSATANSRATSASDSDRSDTDALTGFA